MPQVKVKHGIHVDKAPREVYAFLSDPDKIPQWQSTSFKVGKKQGAAKGKLKKGERVHDQRNVLGVDIDGEWEVAEAVQDQKLVFRMVQGPIDWQMTFTLEPHEGGTLLTAEGGGDLKGVTLKPAAANRAGQRLIENDLKTLANILEK